MLLQTGASASAKMVVTEADTAAALHTGDVPVLATPRLVALAEEATVLAIESALEEGMTSVGFRVQLNHIAPTAVGGHLQADAVLETVEGRRCTFRVSIVDSQGLVASGRITRVVVDRERFIDKAGI